MLTTKQLIAKYGKPTIDGKEYLVTINLPYPMRIAWDLDEKVTKMRCHKLVADKFKLVFNDLLAHYGYEKLVELGIELEDIAVELNDRAGNNFDELLVRRLNKVIFELQICDAWEKHREAV